MKLSEAVQSVPMQELEMGELVSDTISMTVWDSVDKPGRLTRYVDGARLFISDIFPAMATGYMQG